MWTEDDWMANTYSISRCTWKWEELFLHLLDLSILSSFILFTSYGFKLSHKNFRLALVRDLIEESERVPQIQTTLWGTPTSSTSQLEI
jgi:hypothetical protein